MKTDRYIISPTGLGIREQDEWGKGCFKAPRRKLVKGEWVEYEHNGTDFRICKQGKELEIGRPVYSPCTGKVARKVFPYRGSSHYRGILITNDFAEFMMFYLVPFPRLLHFGTPVKIGQEIGLAQDITKKSLPEKYPGMIPHIHLQIQIHPDNLLSGEEQYIDPEVLM